MNKAKKLGFFGHVDSTESIFKSTSGHFQSSLLHTHSLLILTRILVAFKEFVDLRMMPPF